MGPVRGVHQLVEGHWCVNMNFHWPWHGHQDKSICDGIVRCLT